jgi:hypothetical protein
VPGDLLAEPFFFLRKDAIPAALASKTNRLQALAAELLATGHAVNGIDLGWGRFRLNKLQELDYADNFFWHRYQESSKAKMYTASTEMMDSRVQLGTDVCDLGPVRQVDRKHLAGLIQDRLQQSDSGFDRVYLGQREQLAAGFKHVPLHYTPPMVYQTSHSRQFRPPSDYKSTATRATATTTVSTTAPAAKKH